MSENIKIVAKMQVKPENLETFKNLAAELVEKSRQEPGNCAYSLNASKKDSCLLAFIETWQDKEALKVHKQTEHFTRILPQLLQLCNEDPVSEMYTEL